MILIALIFGLFGGGLCWTLSGNVQLFADRRFDTSVLTSHDVTSRVACLGRCLQNEACEAVNLQEEGGAVMTCQLLETRETSESSLQHATVWAYMCEYTCTLIPILTYLGQLHFISQISWILTRVWENRVGTEAPVSSADDASIANVRTVSMESAAR